jgi:two-component sensor histidine kinase
VEVMDNRNHIAELEVRFETAKKVEELTRQSLEMEKKKSINRNFFWLSSMLSLLVIGGGAFLWLKIKSNRSLAAKNNIISTSLKEKELLLNEIHHRVKNNLQVISSLLNLQSKYIEDPSALEAIKEGRNRVNSMSLIHQHLYGKENLAKIDVRFYLEKLSDSLFQSYNINRNRVQLITEVEPLTLDIDILIPVGLILNELISNALKHAFPNGREGNVRVIIKRQTSNLVLEVNDNGVGAVNNAGNDSNESFGMDMIKAFAQKLKATLEIKYQPGVSARLIIPHPTA